MKRKKKINIQDISEGMNIFDIKKKKIKQTERELELKKRQLKNIPISKKLRPNDLHRIAQHTENSIFDEEKCCIWTGYVTNLKNKKKGTYINFYFRDKKKVALHRLLYANFKGDIEDKDYIKYSCSSKGKCCNINHMIKFEYNINDKSGNANSSDIESSDNDDDFKIVIY